MSEAWTPTSWQHRPAGQQPDWPDADGVDRALKTISSFPPLVFAGEARSLQASLGQVVDGHAFLLQAGDCAESFDGPHHHDLPHALVRRLARPVLKWAAADARDQASLCKRGFS